MLKIYEMREILEPFALEQVFSLSQEYLKDLRKKIWIVPRTISRTTWIFPIPSRSCKNYQLKKQLQILANQSFQIDCKSSIELKSMMRSENTFPSWMH